MSNHQYIVRATYLRNFEDDLGFESTEVANQVLGRFDSFKNAQAFIAEQKTHRKNTSFYIEIVQG
jgi:hypothetical protein